VVAIHGTGPHAKAGVRFADGNTRVLLPDHDVLEVLVDQEGFDSP